MQLASDDFKTFLSQKTRTTGSFELTIQDCPYIFKIGSGYTLASQQSEIIKYGMGYKFGDINPLTGSVLKYGDEVPTGQVIYGKLSNITELSNISYTVNNQKRIPNVPALELTIIFDEYFSYIPENLLGKYAELRYGIASLVGYNVIIYNGYISDWKLKENGKKMEIVIEHPLTNLRSDLFGYPNSELKNDITASSTSLELMDASEFPNSGRIRIGDEQIIYTSKTNNILSGLTRGVYSYASAHKGRNITAGEKVYYIQYFNNYSLLDILLMILTSTGSGNNGSWDVLPVGCGCGISIDYIDLYSFQNYVNPALTYYNPIYGTNISTYTLFDPFYYDTIDTYKIINSILYMLCGFLVLDNNMRIKIIPDAYDTQPVLYPSYSNCLEHIDYEQTEEINYEIYKIQLCFYDTNWKVIERYRKDTERIKERGEKQVEIYLPLYSKFQSGASKPGTPPPQTDEREYYYHFAHLWNWRNYRDKRNILISKHPWSQLLYECGDIISYNNKQYLILGRKINIPKMQLELNSKEQYI